MPLPGGEYMIAVDVGAYNDWKALIKIYFEVD